MGHTIPQVKGACMCKRAARQAGRQVSAAACELTALLHCLLRNAWVLCAVCVWSLLLGCGCALARQTCLQSEPSARRTDLHRCHNPAHHNSGNSGRSSSSLGHVAGHH